MKYALFASLLIYFNVFLGAFSIEHGFSIGDLSVYGSQERSSSEITVLGYRILDSSTGLGFTVNGLTIYDGVTEDPSYSIKNSIGFLGLEANWEPFYSRGSFWGTGLFFRIDSIFPTDNLDWRTGARIDLRFPDINIIYPLLVFEAGYWNDRGVYFGAKIDPIVLLLAMGIAFTEDVKDEYDPIDRDFEDHQEDIPEWTWVPE